MGKRQMEKKNKIDLFKNLSAIMAIIILSVLGILNAYHSYIHLDPLLYKSFQRIAVTISLCAVGVTIYDFDKNPFFTLILFLLGLFNLISADILFDTSVTFTYLATVILVYDKIFKKHK